MKYTGQFVAQLLSYFSPLYVPLEFLLFSQLLGKTSFFKNRKTLNPRYGHFNSRQRFENTFHMIVQANFFIIVNNDVTCLFTELET